jgi:[ribosomal protein S5]-alanine N-acetyltransferase
MERMPFRSEVSVGVALDLGTPPTAVCSDWQRQLPVLTGASVTLRELRLEDAPTLLAMMTAEETARFMSPPPTDVEGFERFILWTHRERAAGRHVCFGIVPNRCKLAIGLFQVRQLEPGFATAEWGVAIGSPFWGTGIYSESAGLVAEFTFGTLGVHRLEARAAIVNGRANGALRKIGAVQEGVLRRSFLHNGQYLDQILWSILKEDWRRSKPTRRESIH